MRRKGSDERFLCQNCGEDFAKWYGRCPNCKEWNTLVHFRPPKPLPSASRQRGRSAHAGGGFPGSGAGQPDRGLGIPGKPRGPRAGRSGEALTEGEAGNPGGPGPWIPGAEDDFASRVLTLEEVPSHGPERTECGIAEFDRVLGGGIVPGSVVLLGGDPGVGKSTLLLQVASRLSAAGHGVLYVSGEESATQTKLRAQRLGVTPGLSVLAEADLARIFDAVSDGVRAARPGPAGDPGTDVLAAGDDLTRPVEVLVIDSIQSTYLPDLPSAPGSVLQVREGALSLARLAKTRKVAVLLIGHVTKEGNLAGPRTLEHIVDAVMTMEGDRFHAHRIVRSVKNRFGSVHEIGVFDMRENGLQEVTNPSRLFLGEEAGQSSGSVVIAGLEGTRSLLMEVQALVHPTRYGIPQRIAMGFDAKRLAILLAVLVKRGGLDVTSSDVFVNVTGGLRVAEPGVDLGVLLAIASSMRDHPAGTEMAVFGEVGLGGEVRRASHPQRRIAEAVRLGFRRVILPAATHKDLRDESWKVTTGAELMPVATLREALAIVLGDASRTARLPR